MYCCFAKFSDILFHEDDFFLSALLDMSCLIARKSLYISKIVSTLERRDNSFRKYLGLAFEQLQVIFFNINQHEWSTVDLFILTVSLLVNLFY